MGVYVPADILPQLVYLCPGVSGCVLPVQQGGAVHRADRFVRAHSLYRRIHLHQLLHAGTVGGWDEALGGAGQQEASDLSGLCFLHFADGFDDFDYLKVLLKPKRCLPRGACQALVLRNTVVGLIADCLPACLSVCLSVCRWRGVRGCKTFSPHASATAGPSSACLCSSTLWPSHTG